MVHASRQVAISAIDIFAEDEKTERGDFKNERRSGSGRK